MYVPKEKETSLKKWVNDFNSKFNIQVIIQREQGYSGIISLFNKYFSNKDLLTTQDIPTLNLIQRQFFGTPPKITKEYIESRKKINSYKLPSIPRNYYIELTETEEAIAEVVKELEMKRGTIKVPQLDKKIVVGVEGTYKNGKILYAIVLDVRG